MNKNENVVIAAFGDGAAAEAAIERLRQWDKNVNDVKLGVIATVANQGGAIKTHVVQGDGLFHRSMPISKEAVSALGNELGDGQVAVVVAGDDYEVGLIRSNLSMAGGRIISASVERTPEEIAAEAKAAEEAANIEALNKGADHGFDVGAINKSAFN